MRITAAWLDSRKRPEKRYDVTLTNRRGLMVRVHPSGAISFRFRYKRSGSTLVMVLGEYPDISLSDAHDQHDRAVKELARGLDPIEERDRRNREAESARQDHAQAGTVADLVAQFIHRKLRAERWDATASQWVRDEKAKTKARKRPKAAADLLGYLDPAAPPQKRRRANAKATLLSVHGKVNARDLTKRQLIALLDEIVDRGAPITANRTYALLNQLFEWAAAKDLIPASPMAGVERPGGEERPRERALNGEEVKAFWSNIDNPKVEMAAPTRLALKLLLVTAQRRGELTFAKWSHFDLHAKLWTIPIELLKSSHARRQKPEPHVVPLSTLALKVLEQLNAITGDGLYVLPAYADMKKQAPYSERVLSRAVRENAEHFGIPHWTPHDLRRTAASFMTKLGIPRLHVEKVLNHSTGDIAEVYDRHDYAAEKRIALERWSAHLTDLIEGRDQKVIPLARTG